MLSTAKHLLSFYFCVNSLITVNEKSIEDNSQNKVSLIYPGWWPGKNKVTGIKSVLQRMTTL